MAKSPTEQDFHMLGQRFGDFPAEGYSFVVDAFRRLLGPGVYFLAKLNQEKAEYLYVGSAKNLLARLAADDHAMLRQALAEADSVYIIKTQSEAEARHLEAWHIAHKRPKYNSAGKAKGALPWRPDYDGFLLQQFEQDFREALRNRLAQ